MLVELTWRMFLRFLKITRRSCIASMQRVDQALGIVVACCVLHNYCQLMGLHSPPRGCQENPFYCASGQVPLLREGQVASQHGEAMCATLFTNWMIVHTNLI
jgi:hypothetical protein